MIDADAFAALICDWCLEVVPGQQVMVATTTLAQEPAVALHAAILDRGAWPLLRLSPPELTAQFLRHARPQQLDGFAPLELTELQHTDSVVRIAAPENIDALAGFDPELLNRFARAQRPVNDARLAGRWCGTIWPTAALARQAAMDEVEYAGFLERALKLERPDPIAAWGEQHDDQSRLIARLERASEIRIEAEGTDLRLRVDGRTWINSDGRRNMPSGEVFTGPHERSATGTIVFDVPSHHRGAEVVRARLRFDDGEVVDASAERGGDRLAAALAIDEGARYLGELGIGTNAGIDRATGSTLLDEKIAGTVHLALGRSYPETSGTNVSALHWDLICDLRTEGMLSADGEAVIRDGGVVG